MFHEQVIAAIFVAKTAKTFAPFSLPPIYYCSISKYIFWADLNATTTTTTILSDFFRLSGISITAGAAVT